MVCASCGGNVTWRGPITNLTHTECADCGAINNQLVDPARRRRGRRMIRHIRNQYLLSLRAGFRPRKAATRALRTYVFGF
jgi:hypothetical protein